MKTIKATLTLLLLALTRVSTSAATLYVDLNSTNPTPPYSSLSTAATDIQTAIDAASDGDKVLVNDGIYQTGGRAVSPGVVTNRVVITNAINVESINGPAVTAIQGYQMPGVTNGAAAVRCVYMENGARLAGFTITNGASGTSSTFDEADDQIGGIFVPHASCVVSNCVIIGNAGYNGAGAVNCVLQRCVLSGNSAFAHPGAAELCDLDGCIISSNHTYYGSGGGVRLSTLNNCLLTGNYLDTDFGQSGGADNCWLTNCTLIGNLSQGWGGGAGDSTLYNCLIVSNTAADGGGASGCNLYNCTVTGNIGSDQGGGALAGASYNSILYFNDAPTGPNYWKSPCGSFNTCGKIISCCTTPMPGNAGDGVADWTGTFTNAPLFVDPSAGNFRLQPGSSCVNAGSNSYVSVFSDLDGKARVFAATVDVGAYEWAPSVHYVDLNSTNPTPPFTTWSTAATNIQDAIDVATDGERVLVTNGVYQAGGRVIYGLATNRVAITKAITVQSVNGPQSTMIAGFANTASPPSGIRCVYLTNGAALSGFTLTNGCARNTGDGVLERSGGGVWCENASATISNCVMVKNFASQYGGGAFRGTLINCAFFTNSGAWGAGAASNSLTGCTLTGNAAVYNNFNRGGGAYVCTLTNCLLTKNSAISSAEGGGAYGSTLFGCVVSNNFLVGGGKGGGLCLGTAINCLISSNRADSAGGTSLGGGSCSNTLINCMVRNNFGNSGGGAFASALLNCTVVSNTASQAGGGMQTIAFATNCTATNCIVYYNTSAKVPNLPDIPASFCCTPSIMTNGVGNFTNPPAFVDLANADFHLQSNSACINAGNNSQVTSIIDLDGAARIVGGTIDVGCYEFQSPASTISYAWLANYGLPTDGSADAIDSDHDGLVNWQEWRAGTDPTNTSSVLSVLTASNNVSSTTITWQSVSGVNYFIQRATDLSNPAPFSTIQNNIVGQTGTTSFSDTSAPTGMARFYRIGVQ